MTQLYSGPASGLGFTHIGNKLTVERDGTSYEGVLTYLSFDATRGADEQVAIALGQTDDPVDDLVLYMPVTVMVLAEAG